MTLRQRAVEAVRRYYGTKFGHHGRRPGLELDCVGLPVCAYREAGARISDTLSYRRTPSSSLLVSMLRVNLFQQTSVAEDGDLLLFWMTKPGKPIHVGIADGDGFWHVELGRRVEWITMSSEWRGRLHGAYRRAV